MGITKRTMEEQEDMFNQAQDILLKIGAISECPYHPGTYIDNYMDNNETYAKATYLYKKDHAPDKNDIKNFQEAVKNVIDNCSDECFSCKKNEEE